MTRLRHCRTCHLVLAECDCDKRPVGWLPTPNEIALACQAIKDSWDETTERARRLGRGRTELLYSTPLIRSPVFNGKTNPGHPDDAWEA